MEQSLIDRPSGWRRGLIHAVVGGACLALTVACATPSHTARHTADHTPTAATETVDSAPDAADSTNPQTAGAAHGESPLPGTIIDEPTEEPEEAPVEGEALPEDEPLYDVPIVLNESVEGHLEYFQTTIRERFAMWLQRSKQYLPLMKETFRQHGLPEDLVFVALIESGFNPYAYSRAKAVGPWQFITGTGRRYGLRINEWIDERRDPVKSTDAAARYLKDLYAMFNSWPLALASYNAGEGRVARAIARTKSEDFWEIKRTHHLRPETRNYVPKFMAATIIAKNPERYGFSLTDVEPFAYDEATIDSPTDLRVIAKAAGVDYEQVKTLNPELRQGITPLYYKDYQIKLPPGTREIFLENFSTIPKEERLIWLRHIVRQGETLSTLARRYGTTVPTLQDANRLGRSTMLRIGASLIIPAKGATASMRAPEPSGPVDSTLVRKETYRVRSGDTLWKISNRYNVTVKQIQDWNRLSTTGIRPGQRLILYLPGQLS
jgi:membrane-bound lytic murein transglycosylase D